MNRKSEYIAIILSIISFILVIKGILSKEEYSFFNISNKSLLLFGVFSYILFFIFYLRDFAEPIIENFYSKLVFSLFTLSLTMVCVSEASNIINEVYSGIDPSLFVYSKIFLAGIIFFKKVFPFLFIFLIIMTFLIFTNILNIYIENKKNKTDIETYYLGIIKYFSYIFSLLTLTIFSWNMNENYFNDKHLKDKAYLISRSLDFYSYPEENILCYSNKFIPKGKAFTYLDSQHKKIMIDTQDLDKMGVWDILNFNFNDDKSNYLGYSLKIKPDLKVIDCL